MNDVPGRSPPGAFNMLFFLLVFLLPAAFTYFSAPMLAVAAVIAADVENAQDSATMMDVATDARQVLLGGCYLLMFVACYVRGRRVGRVWLTAFPVVGGIFDLWLPFIPLVPSVMNVAVLAAGIPQPSK